MRVSPQLEDGYTRVANELLEALIATRLSGEELRIVLAVIRKAYGFNKKVDRISMGQFEKLTGIPNKRCQRVMKSVVEKNVVIKGGSFWEPSYGLQKNYLLWNSDVTPQEEGTPQVGGRVPPRRGVKVPPRWGDTKDSKDTLKEKNEINEVFEAYNTITQIRSRSDSRKSKIRARIKEHGKNEVLRAIENYRHALDDPENHWTHRFPIEDFMTPKNMDRFLAMGPPAEEVWKEMPDAHS